MDARPDPVAAAADDLLALAVAAADRWTADDAYPWSTTLTDTVPLTSSTTAAVWRIVLHRLASQRPAPPTPRRPAPLTLLTAWCPDPAAVRSEVAEHRDPRVAAAAWRSPTMPTGSLPAAGADVLAAVRADPEPLPWVVASRTLPLEERLSLLHDVPRSRRLRGWLDPALTWSTDDPGLWDRLLTDRLVSSTALLRLATHPAGPTNGPTPAEAAAAIRWLWEHGSPTSRAAVAYSAFPVAATGPGAVALAVTLTDGTPLVVAAASDPDPSVRAALARNTTIATVDTVDTDLGPVHGTATHVGGVARWVRDRLRADPDPKVLAAAIRAGLFDLFHLPAARAREIGDPDQITGTYRLLAAHPDSRVRVEVAAHTATPDSVRAALETDPAVEVRAAVAQLSRSPDQLDRLAGDGDARVRGRVVDSRYTQVATLRRLMGDPDGRVSQSAVSALTDRLGDG